jgi:hypothetical protein
VSLKVPYQKYPDPQAIDGFFYAAAIPVSIGLPAKNSPRSKRFEAIIDSGASQCIFHASIGRAIGLDIEKGRSATTQGIAGPVKLYLHDISLRTRRNCVGSCRILGFTPYCRTAGHGWIF